MPFPRFPDPSDLNLDPLWDQAQEDLCEPGAFQAALAAANELDEFINELLDLHTPDAQADVVGAAARTQAYIARILEKYMKLRYEDLVRNFDPSDRQVGYEE